MLVCPQCQFENPTANKFCQKCGTSLTQNVCPECGSLVAFEQANCQVCGAISGVMWLAIVSPELPYSPIPVESDATLEVGSNGYLDLQQRYQLLDSLPAANALGEQTTHVLDRQPFQLSLLETLAFPSSDEGEAKLDNEPAQNTLDTEDLSESMELLTVPAIAQPYIILRNQFDYAIPAIHNAWQWHGKSIILLEDRSHYPPLVDAWIDNQASLPLLQILQWLYEMVELWQGLEVWGSEQSLLVLSNLCVEEDKVLCLRRLYPNPGDSIPTLQDLGKLWQVLFAESQKTTVEAITQLLWDLDAEAVATVVDLKSRIEAIAQSIQPDTPSPNFDLDLSAQLSPLVPNGLDALDAESFGADLSLVASPTRIEPPQPAFSAKDDDNTFENDEMPTIVLPMQLFSLEEVGRTDVGRQRDHNEDYFGIETQISKIESPSGKTVHARNLYVLCDGMGGHAGGEVASALAVDTIRKFFQDHWLDDSFPSQGSAPLPTATTMKEAVLLANKTIYDVNQQNARSGSGRMGTTLVLLLIQDTEVAIAHVGDSRLYRYTRKRGLEQMTVDHEVGQREIQRGIDPEVAYSRPDAYQLTQALGPRDEHFVKPDVQFFEINEDMLLLLCSDGLSDNDFLEKHWESCIQPLLSSQTNLDKGVNSLIEMANRYNGHDNISAIAVRAKVRPSLEHLR